MRLSAATFVLGLCLLSRSTFGAYAQSDLAGDWTGSLTDASGMVHALTLKIDATGAVSDYTNALLFGNLAVVDSSGTLSGTLTFRISLNFENLYTLQTGAVALTATPAGGLRVTGPCDEVFHSFTVAPSGSLGQAQLDISRVSSATATLKFAVKRGAEPKSVFTVQIQQPAAASLRLPAALALKLGSASYSIALDSHGNATVPGLSRVRARFSRTMISLTITGLNLIELLPLDLNTDGAKTVAPEFVLGIAASPAGAPPVLVTTSGTLAYTVRNGSARGSNATK